jgi:hypothetical protein
MEPTRDLGLTDAMAGFSRRGTRPPQAAYFTTRKHGMKNIPSFPSSVSDSRLSRRDIGSDHIQVVAGGFESLLGIMVRNKSGVIIKRNIALPA